MVPHLHNIADKLAKKQEETESWILDLMQPHLLEICTHVTQPNRNLLWRNPLVKQNPIRNVHVSSQFITMKMMTLAARFYKLNCLVC